MNCRLMSDKTRVAHKSTTSGPLILDELLADVWENKSCLLVNHKRATSEFLLLACPVKANTSRPSQAKQWRERQSQCSRVPLAPISALAHIADCLYSCLAGEWNIQRGEEYTKLSGRKQHSYINMADRVETSNKSLVDKIFSMEVSSMEQLTNQRKWKRLKPGKKRDASAMFVLTSAMDFKQIAIIENCSMSFEIIEKLDSIYQQKSEFNKMMLLEKFHRLKMELSESVICYISRAENVVKQIRDAGETITEKALVTKILCTLPEKFRNFRQAWLSTDEGKQTLSNLTTRFLDEESNPTQCNEGSESALYVPKYIFSKRSEGHIARECKEPSSHKSRFQNRSYDESVFLVSNCSVSEEMHSIVVNDVKSIMDSGASCHMTYIKEILEDFVEMSDSVALGNSAKLDVKGLGNVKIEKCVNNEWIEETYFQKVSSPTRVFVVKNNLYTMLFKTPKLAQSELNVTENSYQMWHERLGHINKKFLSTVPDLMDYVKFDGNRDSTKCNFQETWLEPQVLVSLSIVTCVDQCLFHQYEEFSGYRFARFLKQFKHVVNLCENKFGHNVKRLRVDNDTKFVNSLFQEYLYSNGIVIEKTAPYSPEQNGRIERENRTVMECARSMLFSRDVPQYIWAAAVNTVVYISNCIPNSLCIDETPYEKWMGKRPSLSHAHVFGCEAHSLVPSQKQNKLVLKSIKLVFVGYDGDSNNYRLFDPLTKTITVSRNVIFRESGSTHPVVEQKHSVRVSVENGTDSMMEEVCCKETLINPAEENELEFRGFESLIDLDDVASEQTGMGELGKRSRRLSQKLKDFELNCVEALSVGQYPSTFNPRMFREAVENGWSQAIQEELDALNENRTWELVCMPKGVDVIDSIWVFTEKVQDGQMAKKAQLKVTEDLFAPVARMSTIRILLAVAIENNMKIRQIDVKSAFLNSLLSESVCMAVPEEVPKCWNNTLNDGLLQLGFTCSNIDVFLYFNCSAYILIYVDDVLVVYNEEVDVCKIVDELKKNFRMQEFSNDNNLTFLGGLALNQSILIDKILERFCMSDCSLPIEHGLSLDSPEPGKVCNVPYKEMLGSLMYIMTGTIPDISFSVLYFSWFQKSFDISTWKHLKNILKYLKGTRSF
ncbi:hypothetical protein PR048_013239 [Dryococelus australis]|uniref:Integrase catalytic domain-containing protein n=1 Tax=Dryococelus australis TaxID=614101 RepID=A0ABQ9HRK5_9NEOP|nr:hypothetical protein PR048_013239 [Dryococelus australis]